MEWTVYGCFRYITTKLEAGRMLNTYKNHITQPMATQVFGNSSISGKRLTYGSTNQEMSARFMSLHRCLALKSNRYLGDLAGKIRCQLQALSFRFRGADAGASKAVASDFPAKTHESWSTTGITRCWIIQLMIVDTRSSGSYNSAIVDLNRDTQKWSLV